MPKGKIQVQGLEIRLEPIQEERYVCLTDIAKQAEDKRAAVLIGSWMKNNNTLLFMEQWEKLHNPDFKVDQMVNFRMKTQENRYVATAQKYIKATNAIGIISKSGRYGGTYAHQDIALNFCYWLSPAFQVFMIKAFQELMAKDFERQNLEWHISKLTDNVEEMRNLLDTIPGQLPNRNRLLGTKGEEDV